jgi:hypothetical protein
VVRQALPEALEVQQLLVFHPQVHLVEVLEVPVHPVVLKVAAVPLQALMVQVVTAVMLLGLPHQPVAEVVLMVALMLRLQLQLIMLLRAVIIDLVQAVVLQEILQHQAELDQTAAVAVEQLGYLVQVELDRQTLFGLTQ